MIEWRNTLVFFLIIMMTLCVPFARPCRPFDIRKLVEREYRFARPCRPFDFRKIVEREYRFDNLNSL